jgi:hypothetical protein
MTPVAQTHLQDILTMFRHQYLWIQAGSENLAD